MANLISQPPINSVDTQDAQGNFAVSQGWAAFFSTVSNILVALTSSGLTGQRPTKFLWVGRPFFDQTLGYEIRYNGAVWVRWDGVPV